MADEWDWIDSTEKKREEERNKEYFRIVEGDNRFVLLSHIAPLPQVWTGTKYRPAAEGDDPKSVSIKGVCWVYQEGMVKQAKLPYKVIKEIRGLQQNPDWEFKLPFPHIFTLKAEGAGESTVKYSINASPKQVPIPQEILDELAKKPSPEEIVELIKSGRPAKNTPTTSAEAQGHDSDTVGTDYPTEDINPDDIPF